MKIALAQMEVIPNRPDKNLERMLAMIEQAKQKGVDLIAFPEMCIGGYLLGDKWYNDDFCRDLMEYGEDIRKASDGIAIAFGNICLDENEAIKTRTGSASNHPNEDGRTRKYNAVYVVQDGKYAPRAHPTNILPEGVTPKTLLPPYRIFDDPRYFFSTQKIAIDFDVPLEELLLPFEIIVKGEKMLVGFELCEDLWCEDYRKDDRALNPTRMLINNGAELIVNLSASPWTYGKNSARDRRVQFLAKDCEKFVPFVYVNCVSVQNNGKNIVTFDGGSTAYNQQGMPIRFSKAAYQVELMVIDDFETPALVRHEESRPAQTVAAIVKGIQSMKEMMGISNQPKYVIGLSGGIDSAVVAALLTLAVGSDRVLAINMPTAFNSERTKQAAAQIAESLGMTYVQIPIGELVSCNEALLEKYELTDDARLTTLNKENIQAKIRGTSILSNVAAQYHALFTNNGNKVELAVGYATLYGDLGGAFAPIGDQTKRQIMDIARYLNTEVFRREVIPAILIPDELFRFRPDQIQPSAELRENQVDPMKFGYHCAVIEAFMDYQRKTPEDLLRWYLAGTLEPNLNIPRGMLERYDLHDPNTFVTDLEWLTDLIQRSVFKRVQAPPIILTSKTAYGFDDRECMLPLMRTREYGRLKEQVLALDAYRSTV